MKTLPATVALAALACFLVAPPVWGHWDDGDPFKMHFPQLPNPGGWDIDVTANNVVADDWLCTQTGPVTDVHVWYSWEQDLVGVIDQVKLSIHTDIPAGVGGLDFSRPGDLLWDRVFGPDEFVTRLAGTGVQGFYDAGAGWLPNDHFNYYQLNIVGIEDPFEQLADTIYWLDLSVLIRDPLGTHIGWKTSLDTYQDDSVIFGANGWEPLVDPVTGISLDQAFVITPEPAALVLIGLGAVVFFRRRGR